MKLCEHHHLLAHLQLVCFFFLFFSEALALKNLKCHHCTSTKSWEDCKSVHNTSTATCRDTFNDAVCYKIHYATSDGSINKYEKSCGTKTFCQKESNPICRDHSGTPICDIHCCRENMCNAGSIAGVSGVFMAAGVLIMMLFVKT